MRYFEPGFVVLRKPEHNYDFQRRDLLRESAPRVDNIFYGGFDRMAWFDLDEGHYSRSLPPEMEEKWRLINEEKSPSYDIATVREFSVALEVLEYANKSTEINEICAICSLRQDGNEFLRRSGRPIQWLGADLAVSGYGSPVSAGLFARPDLFPEFVKKLNSSGLFQPS